jgi:hypothetical protein
MQPEKHAGRRPLAWPWAAAIAVVAGLLRLVPHPPNFTPVGALGLFGGAKLRSWRAFALPVLAMAGPDLILWWLKGYPPFNPFVYGSLLLNVLLGRWLLRTGPAWRVAPVSLLASMQFFLLTNFGAWLGPHNTLYSRDLGGLLLCYTAALPFFGNTVAGDLLYSAALWGGYALLAHLALLRKERQPA